MVKTKFYMAITTLSLIALLVGSCAGEPSPPSEEVSPTPEPPITDLKVTDASEALDIALIYLREQEPDNAPSVDITWQEEDVTPKDEYGHPVPGGVHKEFTSNEWTVRVSYAVLPPERTVYRVVVSSIKLGWHWKGDVKADGSPVEVSAFRQMSEEESKNMAEELLRNSATFVFDGIEDTLILADTLRARCPYCWVFIFEFDSEHPGYADRTGKSLAEVITLHQAVISVEQLEIISAIMDDKWDVLRHEVVGIEETLDVAELLDNPVYETLVRTHGVVSGLGEFFCPCFELTSGGKTIMVWYDMMVENDGTERPPANKHEFDNGDRVIVIGELKGEGGTHYSKGDFWASDITYVFPAPPPEKVRDEKQETLILEDTIWVLESYGEKENLQTVLEDAEITIEFGSEEGRFAGSAGCNSYFGGYEINKSELSIKLPIGSTVMACPEPIMEQEKEYLELLKTTETFQIQNGKLTISCSGNKMLVFIAQ